MNTTKQLLPSRIGCIDKEWLEGEIESVKSSAILDDYAAGVEAALLSIKSQLFPLEPIIAESFGMGYGCGFNAINLEQGKENCINQPIKINKNE
jgi:hypothetical protein